MWAEKRTVIESLEPRRLLASAGDGFAAWSLGCPCGTGACPACSGYGPAGQATAVDLISAAGEVSAAWSSRTADYWRDTGALGGTDRPSGWTVQALALHTFELDGGRLSGALSVAPWSTAEAPRRLEQLPVVLLPTPQGGFARFAIERTSLLAPDVAAANPDVQTFRGYGLDDLNAIAHFDLTAKGFHATISSPRGTWVVEPAAAYDPVYSRGEGTYGAYFLAHQPLVDADGGLQCGCGVEHEHLLPPGWTAPTRGEPGRGPTGPVQFNMRLAVAATAEWVGTAGGTVASAFGTLVSAVNAANLVYTRDMNVVFTLVSGSELIYTNPSTDPYTNNNSGALLNENQANLDSVIGSSNYDIGHVLSTSGGGVAYMGVVGRPSWKAKGNSGRAATSALFELTFFHEMGHQFGAAHTFNHAQGYSGQRFPDSAYEPGPGSTLMSYGGFGFVGDFVTIRDRYFHARSIEQVNQYLTTDFWGSQAGNQLNTGNSAPVVSAGPDYVIPANTPFELIGSGSDSDPLSFVWEQYDLGPEVAIGTDIGAGPLFRSRPATPSPARSFPELADVLAGRSDPDELLPRVSRTFDPLTFRLTAFDGLGGVNSDDVDLVVIDTGAAFAITSHNSGGTWAAGSTQAITWNVAGTTGNGINAALVDVYISYDNGQTFSLLLDDAPNSGVAQLPVPAAAPGTGAARIKVKAEGNVFYDINNAPITIIPDTVPPEVGLFAFEFEHDHRLVLQFSEPVDAATVAPSDLTVMDAATGQAVPTSRFSVVQVGTTWFEFVYNMASFGPLPDGNYLATLAAGSIADLAGNTLAQDAALGFFVLAGDANRDRAVNLGDLAILRANFGLTGRTFSQADFNYDGVVNLSDLSILRARFGIILPPPGSLFGGDGGGGDGDDDER